MHSIKKSMTIMPVVMRHLVDTRPFIGNEINGLAVSIILLILNINMLVVFFSFLCVMCSVYQEHLIH